MNGHVRDVTRDQAGNAADAVSSRFHGLRLRTAREKPLKRSDLILDFPASWQGNHPESSPPRTLQSLPIDLQAEGGLHGQRLVLKHLRDPCSLRDDQSPGESFQW